MTLDVICNYPGLILHEDSFQHDEQNDKRNFSSYDSAFLSVIQTEGLILP